MIIYEFWLHKKCYMIFGGVLFNSTFSPFRNDLLKLSGFLSIRHFYWITFLLCLPFLSDQVAKQSSLGRRIERVSHIDSVSITSLAALYNCHNSCSVYLFRESCVPARPTAQSKSHFRGHLHKLKRCRLTAWWTHTVFNTN